MVIAGSAPGFGSSEEPENRARWAAPGVPEISENQHSPGELAPRSADRDAASSGAVAAVSAVEAAERALGAVAGLTDFAPESLSANDLLRFVGLLANISRVVEGRQVSNVGDIARRSDTGAGFDGLAARHGSASPTALFEKVTGVKNSTAYRYTKLAQRTTPRVSDTGLPLEPVFAQTAKALAEGTIGLDVAEAITSTLAPVLSRVAPEQLDWAEATLLGNATGADGEVPVAADALRGQARMFCAVLDPDGVQPSAEELHEARSLVFRHLDDGSMRLTGVLSPEQAAHVTPVFDAFMSKRTSPAFMQADELAAKEQAPENRSRPQERADVFTSIVAGTGTQDSTPKLHGRAPTVLVTVSEDDLENGNGAAWSPGTPAALPMSFVKQMRCNGNTRRVTIDQHGDVLNLGDTERFFTAKQRLALVARDGTTCAAVDCDIPAWLCEAHHIQGWDNGGPTNLDNGVLLCWFHHRLVEHGEWAITRNHDGHPKLVPPGWYVNRKYLGKRRRQGDNEDGNSSGDNPDGDDPGESPRGNGHGGDDGPSGGDRPSGSDRPSDGGNSEGGGHPGGSGRPIDGDRPGGSGRPGGGTGSEQKGSPRDRGGPEGHPPDDGRDTGPRT
ncbi:HNH endonuclease signature motif containing protein [Microbacterium sp. MPKO10]|uniref:HNH endonuclease signature motif containing protein n=1 Tax=Microbacterium sp. MPKO10 TaxID=2989818 RepID=UPI0022358A1C|nr:HNH endonuclease signature motif containing protein [Microbacterium sp. MPKO10]MCW4457320.1 HNH endonuclease [Microbacterium sp. MPKO10]